MWWRKQTQFLKRRVWKYSRKGAMPKIIAIFVENSAPVGNRTRSSNPKPSDCHLCYWVMYRTTLQSWYFASENFKKRIFLSFTHSTSSMLYGPITDTLVLYTFGEKWLLLEDFFKFINQIESSWKQRGKRQREVTGSRGAYLGPVQWYEPRTIRTANLNKLCNLRIT
jgi:hypothetical protein